MPETIAGIKFTFVFGITMNIRVRITQVRKYGASFIRKLITGLKNERIGASEIKLVNSLLLINKDILLDNTSKNGAISIIVR
jgi:hypothetical protein